MEEISDSQVAISRVLTQVLSLGLPSATDEVFRMVC
jgi:hypothetical protein